MRSINKLLLGVFAAIAILVTISGDLLAVIGRPATPVSVAGAARRSVRRGHY